MTRGRVVVAVVAVMGVVAVTVVLAARSVTSSCAFPAPLPDLPASLRAQGGYDSPFDPADVRSLQEAAQRAAVTIHPGLIGSDPAPPVTVHAPRNDVPGAVVVPLRRVSSGDTRPFISGYVVFLRDCGGRLYYSRSESAAAATSDFPAETESEARVRLGGAVELAYDTDPLQAHWRLAAAA